MTYDDWKTTNPELDDIYFWETHLDEAEEAAREVVGPAPDDDTSDDFYEWERLFGDEVERAMEEIRMRRKGI